MRGNFELNLQNTLESQMSEVNRDNRACKGLLFIIWELVAEKKSLCYKNTVLNFQNMFRRMTNSHL